MFKIQPYEEKDWPAVWEIIHPVFKAGETYSFPPDTTEDEAKNLWINTPKAAFVAKDEKNQIIGTYFIKPNQPGLGSHVCNCGYIVAQKARGKGAASAMCVHSQEIAVSLGFRAMQYNMVVTTNKGAVRLWKKHGFEIIGTLPGAFRHSRFGYVDAHVMYKLLVK